MQNTSTTNAAIKTRAPAHDDYAAEAEAAQHAEDWAQAAAVF
jgi:hypothetical protein